MTTTLFKRLIVAALLLTYPAVRAFQASSNTATPPEIRYPAQDAGVDSLARRAQEQKQAATQYPVVHDFHFEDKLPESGITFRQRIVDDSGLNYKPVHYDHGNGIAVIVVNRFVIQPGVIHNSLPERDATFRKFVFEMEIVNNGVLGCGLL